MKIILGRPVRGLWMLTLITGVSLNAFTQQNLKATHVNVFKNGTYFVVKEGSIPLTSGKGSLLIPSAPLLGTFWLTTPKDIAISRLIFIMDTIKTSRNARTMPDLLISNKGKKVKLSVRMDEKNYQEISGLLQDFFPASQLVKIKGNEGRTLYFPLADVRQLMVEESPSESLKTDSVAYVARLEFNRNPTDTRIKMVYMQAGIQWFPSYNIKILNDKELQLELRALVENFAETLEETGLTLTVGDPSYKYGRTQEQFANPFLTQTQGAAYNPYAAYMWQNTAAESVDAAVMYTAKNDQYNNYQTYQTEGDKTGDLYMYDLGKVSIPKFSKAAFPVFSHKVPYRDVFRVTLGDINNFLISRQIVNDPERKFPVFHSLKLTNQTKDPFTHAPVFIMDEELRPLAQDEIAYTPVNTTVSVNLAQSPDIVVTNTEEEKNREERAKTIDKHGYTRVLIHGMVEIHNTMPERVTVNVEKTVNGLITEAGDNGKITRLKTGDALNPFSRVDWELSLGTQEKKVIAYDYEVFILAY
ncbi:MAG TPA: hypothetical protein P5531_08420 [Bacteroidales bacterium]|nr:hypothetical protein [Bacteroidales bacterium]HSA43551.1 hypothetical protein [Bacteroidales bacterium]